MHLGALRCYAHLAGNSTRPAAELFCPGLRSCSAVSQPCSSSELSLISILDDRPPFFRFDAPKNGAIRSYPIEMIGSAIAVVFSALISHQNRGDSCRT